MEHYFRFSGGIIRDKTWASLSFSAQAVFPVIACHCNIIGKAFPAEKRIGNLAGLTEKIVRRGINDLEASNILKVSGYITRRGHKGKKFHVSLPPPQHITNFSGSDTKAPFPFHSSIIDSCWGCWKNLTPSAKALYPVMRYFAFTENDNKEEYLKRDFDCCEAESDVLAEYAGITTKSVKSAISSLAANDLLEEIEESHGTSWYVYLRRDMPF